MDNWQWLCFIPFVVIALANLKTLIDEVIKKQEVMYAPVVGLITFFLATLTLDKDYNCLIWLFVLFDVGTLFLIVHLPFLLKEVFIYSRFCRYRIYKNTNHLLTLYRFKNHQPFVLAYQDQDGDNLVAVSLSGDWQITEDRLVLMNNDILASAKMHQESITFDRVYHNFEFLKGVHLLRKYP